MPARRGSLPKDSYSPRRSRLRSACDTRRLELASRSCYLQRTPATQAGPESPALPCRGDSSRTRLLQRQYRDAARAGDWLRCRILAEQMRGLERDNKLAAEAAYALGFALEMLGDQTQAAKHYEHALLIDRSHGKARKRLALIRPRT